MVMNLLLSLLLALPFACLAMLSLVAFLGVAAIAGALSVIGTITSALGIAVRKNADPLHGAVGDAHPLDYVEAAGPCVSASTSRRQADLFFDRNRFGHDAP
jgi:hypothetical protein